MKKYLLLIGLAASFSVVKAQDDPQQLALHLTRNSHTDYEKVSAIFHWITDNIAYRVNSGYRVPVIGNTTRKFSRSLNEADADTSPLKPLNERVAINVIRNRVATCEGYSRLFAALCDFAGIRSELIVGYARNRYARPGGERFGVNHFWNAVQIDGKWQLLDATWASGYVTGRGGEFVKEYDPAYFLASPDQFGIDHYPDDQRWSLLDYDKIPGEYYRSPFQQRSYLKYSITSWFPQKGIIETYIGDTLRFTLVTTDPKRDSAISPDYLVDSAIYTHSPAWVFLRPEFDINDGVISNRHTYVLPVTSAGIQWVHLLYNGDMVLRYKLNVKERREVATR
ncbi:MAG: hypothetical protein JNM88_11880 [Chitinophagaceae bacterium]|nr:hypothetical protein [Chitinophagaceae bacterium]